MRMDATPPDYENLYIYPEDVTEEYHIGEAPPQEDDDEIESKISSEHPMEELEEPNLLYGHHQGHVYALAMRGSWLLSGGGDDKAFLVDSTTGTVQHSLQGHSDSIVAVGFNFDGTLAASGGYDGMVRVWRVDTGQIVQTLDGPSQEIEWLQWHKKGNVILAGSSDGTCWMWLAPSGECMHVFAGHEDSVSCGTFTGSGKAILTGSIDCTVRMWNPKSGECMHVYRGHGFHEGPICTITVHPSVSTENSIILS